MEDSAPSPLPHSGEDLFGRYGAAVTIACAAVLMSVIAAIDKLTGYDLQLGILHLVPIAIVTWAAGRRWGLAFAVAAMVIWLAIFRFAPRYQTNLYFYWDALVLFGIFVLFVVLMARLHDQLDRSDARFVTALEKLDAAVYVADPLGKAVLYGNEHFRETLAGRPYEELARRAAKECALTWPDGRRVLLRVLSES